MYRMNHIHSAFIRRHGTNFKCRENFIIEEDVVVDDELNRSTWLQYIKAGNDFNLLGQY